MRPHHKQLTENPTDLVKVINAILEFTGLYLFERNLTQLHMFIAGYERCAALNKIELTNVDVLREFDQYLIKNHRHKKDCAFGWFDFFQLKKISEVEKFELFREYFNQFIEERSLLTVKRS